MVNNMLHVLNNPAIGYYLTLLRNKETSTMIFRQSIKKLAILLSYPMAELIETYYHAVETPLGTAEGIKFKKEIALFPILRSGLLLSQSIEDILPVSFVGLMGIRRNRETLLPETYFSNMPNDLSKYFCFVLDPVLATGKIICKAIELLKQKNAKNIVAISIIATEKGISEIISLNQNVRMMVCHIDPALNSQGYIIPGLGDVGDRAFGAFDNAIVNKEHIE